MRFLDQLHADLRFGLRSLRRNPAFAMASVLTLALGVGGTAAVFGIARALLFEPLPYNDEDRIGVFWKKTDWTEEEFLYLRGRTPGFEHVALYRFRDLILREGDAPARLIPGVSTSAELFDVLGARPQYGRVFRAGEDAAGSEPVAILSWGLWQELGGDPSIVGARLVLDGEARTVIGVMPRGFWFPDPSVRIWTQEHLSEDARSWNSTLIGRVAPGHDARAMMAPVAQLTAMLDERFDYPAQWDKTVDARITPIRDDIVGGMRPGLFATLAAMSLILLMACANVAALMLGRIHARASEVAVRLALGASRRRVLQQLAVETILIALGAGALGAVVAWSSLPLFARALPLGVWTEAVAPDASVFAAAMMIATGAALLVVVVPALSLSRGSLNAVIGAARTGGVEGRGGRLESGLVVAEVALAVLIAAGAALLARSVTNLYALDSGVRTVGTGVIDVTLAGGNAERQRQTLSHLTEALARIPGVQTAGAAQKLPLRAGGYNMPIDIEGGDLDGQTTEFRAVTPGYLETMGITLRAGRTITAADRPDNEPVVVINEALAERYLPGVDPIGRRIADGVGDRLTRVVGVVANAAERQLTDDAIPVRYVAIDQLPWIDPPQSFVFRVARGVDPVALLDDARRTIQREAPGVAVREVTTMSRLLDRAVGPVRQVTALLSMLTGLALTLGAVGVYGVIAHFAARGRRDWAIRMALGLPGSRAVSLIMRHAARLVVAGIAIGAVAGAALARLLSSLLYGVAANDPLAFAAAAAALLAVGLLAAFVPARRAGMVDPAAVLREQ